MTNPLDYLKTLDETKHRVNRFKLHSLEEILFLTIAAVKSGADNFGEKEEFCIDKKDW